MRTSAAFKSFLILYALAASCDRSNSSGKLNPDRDNGGLELPPGFSALVVADSLGKGRHIAVGENGDLFMALEQLHNGCGIVALRDTTGDGRADQIAYFGSLPGTGIHIRNQYLYFAHDTCILRYPLHPESLVPVSPPETVISGFPREYQHASKTIAFDSAGNLYVNIGAPSNACQQNDRTPESPGIYPCPLLESYGGIWRFPGDRLNQTPINGMRYATGLRNCVAIEWNSFTSHLYVVQHGRDQLNQMYPKIYSDENNANLPAEEFFLLNEGDDCGWPYCYYDGIKKSKQLAPEYGGNGDSSGICESKKMPLMAFPAHTAPNDLVFYTSEMFPEPYKNGAFMAFHGSWNRSPLLQEGFNVVFVPFKKELPAGTWEVFADGFAGSDQVVSPGDAMHRPMGLATGPDGSLYISDSVKGTIWRVFYN